MNKEFLIKFEGECEVIHRRGGDSSPWREPLGSRRRLVIQGVEKKWTRVIEWEYENFRDL
jgi:hypothetical protein